MIDKLAVIFHKEMKEWSSTPLFKFFQINYLSFKM